MYTLGLDFSTQSLTAVVLDVKNAQLIHEEKVSFLKWIDEYHLDKNTFTIKNLPHNLWALGQHEQPPLMFLRALDMVFCFMQNAKIELKKIKAISVSAQQHGHVYLNQQFFNVCTSLKNTNSDVNNTLEVLFTNSFAYTHAPIWMTSNTKEHAASIRKAVGGSKKLLTITGSDCPERFTAAVVRRIILNDKGVYQNTAIIHLLSSFFSSILSANPQCPIDYGNASGTSLLHYDKRIWDNRLLQATAGTGTDKTTKNNGHKKTSEADELKKKLPALSSAYKTVGTIAQYFITRYGFSKDCIVCAGSGDNPQTKTMVSGDLLSLGSSFVFMVEQTEFLNKHKIMNDKKEVQYTQRRMVNAMYDGLDRPFSFACRTNGSLLWDRARSYAKIGIKEQESLLTQTNVGECVYLWQHLQETFPVSKKIIPTVHINEQNKKLYPALIDTTFALMSIFTSSITSSGSMYITGGPSNSALLCQRLADILQRTIISIGSVGAAMGAAVSAYAALSDKKAAITLSKKLITAHKTYVPDISKKMRVQTFLCNVKDEFSQYII